MGSGAGGGGGGPCSRPGISITTGPGSGGSPRPSGDPLGSRGWVETESEKPGLEKGVGESGPTGRVHPYGVWSTLVPERPSEGTGGDGDVESRKDWRL